MVAYGDSLHCVVHFWCAILISCNIHKIKVALAIDRGEGGITARLRFKAPWLENCVRQDCDISHSE